MFTCILLIIMSCSTSGCVSPVRFMVPSNMTKAWTDGKEAWTGWSHCTDSIMGILRKQRGGKQEQRFSSNQHISAQKPSYNVDKLNNCGFKTCNGGNTHLFTSDKHSSSLVPSAWLGILPRPSVTFITDCSTLFQAPKEESFRLVCGQQIFWSNYASLSGIACFTGFPHVDLTRPQSHQCG